MGSPIFFNGNASKLLNQKLIFSDGTSIQSGSLDPSAVAVSATIGSLYISYSTGITYRKTDSGSSTNWSNESGVSWGGITGTLSNQTDLNNALALKAPLISPSFTTPALGTPSAGVLTNCTGTASGLTAGHVTTNANLTGPITSSGNATSVAAQTGTGTTFVMQASPALTTPNLGTPTSGVLTSCTGLPVTTGLANITTASILGRTTAGSGAVEVLTQASLPISTATQTALDLKLNIADDFLSSCQDVSINNGTLAASNFLAYDGVSAWTNRTLAATQTLLGLSLKQDLNPTINAQTGTTYTFVLADNGKTVTASNASAQTYTVPTNASIAFPVGCSIPIINLGAGKVTFAAAGGVTLSSLSGNLSISGQYGGAQITKIATDTWILVGSLSA